MLERFSPEKYKKAFEFYFVSLWIVAGVLMTLSLLGWHQSSPAIIAAGEKAIGVVATGAIVVGIVATGALSFGIFAFGSFSVGLFALGAGAVGFISVGACAVGIVAIGPYTIGVYSLSYTERGIGKYVLSLHRQDTKAVRFFTRWLPRLKEAFSPNS